MKKLEWGKYALIYLAGFLTSFSGALDSLVKIPSLYKELKKTYIYDSEFLHDTFPLNKIKNEQIGLPIQFSNMYLK